MYGASASLFQFGMRLNGGSSFQHGMNLKHEFWIAHSAVSGFGELNAGGVTLFVLIGSQIANAGIRADRFADHRVRHRQKQVVLVAEVVVD